MTSTPPARRRRSSAYRLSVSDPRTAAGDAHGALAHAKECAAICERNGAEAFEQFFAQGMLALAHRAGGDSQSFALTKSAALALYATLAADQQRWCESTLELLA